MISGQDFPPERYNANAIGIPYITGASNILNNNLVINRWTSTPSVIATTGDLLVVCKGSGVGKMCKVKIQQCHIARQIQSIRDEFKVLNPTYIEFFLLSSLNDIVLKAQGVIPGISRDVIQNLLFPVPPLMEQEQIVLKIEYILPILEKYSISQEKLDKLNTEINAKLLKSILQEAIQGKLVPQIAEEGTAQELLEQIKEEKLKLVKAGKLKKSALTDSVIYKGDNNKYYEQIGNKIVDISEKIPFDIPTGWNWVRLSSITQIIGGFAFPSSSIKGVDGIRVIRISDFNEDGFTKNKIVRYNSNSISPSYEIRVNDILLAMTGGTVGKSLFVSELPEKQYLLNQRVAIIRAEKIEPAYIDIVIKTQYVKDIINNSKNSTNDNISMSDIQTFLIPLPPLKEQQRVVAQIEKLFEQLR